MELAIKLSIVVGVQHAQENVVEIVRALEPALDAGIELLFCYTAADPDVPTLVGAKRQIRLMRSPYGSLMAHLWRDGILAARGERPLAAGVGWPASKRSGTLPARGQVGAQRLMAPQEKITFCRIWSWP